MWLNGNKASPKNIVRKDANIAQALTMKMLAKIRGACGTMSNPRKDS
jgi:hypothetical protein